MEDTKNDNNQIFKVVAGIVSTLIIAGIIGLFARIENYNERLIRIEERAVNNSKNVDNIVRDVIEIVTEQKRCADKLTLINFRMGYEDEYNILRNQKKISK